MLEGDITAAVAAFANVKAQRAAVWWGTCRDPHAQPYIVALQVGGVRVQHHGGAEQMRTVRVQFDCAAPTLDAALTLRAAVNDGLLGIAQTVGATKILSATHQGDRDAYDDGPDFFLASTDILFQTIPA